MRGAGPWPAFIRSGRVRKRACPLRWRGTKLPLPASRTSGSITFANVSRASATSGNRFWRRKAERIWRRFSIPEELADGLEILDAIAVRLDRHQHRHGEQRSPDSPQKTPEDQPDED